MASTVPLLASDVPDDALEWEFVRSPGPGGQHVNKTASAVQLKFFIDRFTLFNVDQHLRLKALAGRRLNKDGSIIFIAHRHRSQEANRRDALERLVELLNQARSRPKPRIATRPTKASTRRRLESKKTVAQRKSLRRSPLRD